MAQQRRPGGRTPSASGRHWWRWYLLTGLAVTVAVAALPAQTGQTLQMLACLVTGIAVLVGIRLHRPERPAAWWLILAAMGVSTAASVAWLLAAALQVPLPAFGLIDLGYVSIYPLLALALALLPVQGRYGSPLAGMVEAGIVTCTTAVLSWTVLLKPLLRDLGSAPEQVAGVLAYPVLDLLILSMAIRLAIVSGRRVRAHLLVLLGAVAWLVTDTGYVLAVLRSGPTYGTPAMLCGWTLAVVLLGVAALHPTMRAEAARPAGERSTRTGALPFYVVLAVVGPVATGVSLAGDLRTGGATWLDLVVPLGATALTAVLLVARLAQLTGVAQRRAADLDRRTRALEAAVDRQALLQQELTHQALHDPLTGLPNRVLLDERLAEAVAGGAGGALLMLDLDGFKDINDRFGHPTGDALLVAVAGRLAATLPAGDLLVRLGGDEFAVLVPPGPAEAVTARAEAILAAMRHPVDVHGHQLYATASVGIRRLDDAAASADLLGDADLALYAAKASGRDRMACYDERLRAEHLHQSRLVERLREAVRRRELTVHYQPVVRLSDGGWAAVEALVRWQPPGEPMIGPDRFIPAAEDSGLIVPLGEWVLRQACRDAAAWYHGHGVRLSVNVSPRQLREPDFADVVGQALAEAGLPPSALTLEITEGVLVGSGPQADQAIAHLAALRRTGVRVAVDDFGTGYSSLAYLRDLPIDALKIDRSFMPSDGPDAGQRTALVRAIIDLATSLDLRTIAEGVETAGQAALLRELGCANGQGWHFARPAPAAQTALLLAGDGVSTAA